MRKRLSAEFPGTKPGFGARYPEPERFQAPDGGEGSRYRKGVKVPGTGSAGSVDLVVVDFTTREIDALQPVAVPFGGGL